LLEKLHWQNAFAKGADSRCQLGYIAAQRDSNALPPSFPDKELGNEYLAVTGSS